MIKIGMETLLLHTRHGKVNRNHSSFFALTVAVGEFTEFGKFYKSNDT